MNKEEKKEFKRIKKQSQEAWLDDDDIKFLVNSIEKLQKENEKLKSNNKKYTIHLTDKQYNVVIENAQNDINQKWIQKVKDKIEELKQEKGKYGNCLIEMYEDELINRDIKILQELIEESVEK